LRVLLRTMAMQSHFRAGEYKDKTVARVLDTPDPGFIIWTYYTNQYIGFTTDVLRAVGITATMEIEKPGYRDRAFAVLMRRHAMDNWKAMIGDHIVASIEAEKRYLRSFDKDHQKRRMKVHAEKNRVKKSQRKRKRK